MNTQSKVVVGETAAHKAVIESTAVKGLPELLGKELIKTDQDGIRKSLVKLDAAIHANAVQCMLHAHKHGDTSLMRRLLIDIVDAKSGYRRQGLIAWMRRFSPMELSGDVIKLTGTVNDQPIPWDVETANMTPFTDIPEFAEVVQWRPVFKGSLVQKVERALKDYKAAIENTKIDNGKVVGPIDPKKPYYDGIRLDKMDEIFDKIEAATVEFQTFTDSTAEARAARKQLVQAEAALKATEPELAKQANDKVNAE